MITKRDEWKKIKKDHGIPDGVCSFSMGEHIESWHKKIAAAKTAKDYGAVVAAIDGLLKDFRAYEAALKKISPTKFKGKTPAEQTKNLKDTQARVHTEISDLDTIRVGNQAYAAPLTTLKKTLVDAKAKLGSIPKTDLQALKTFYETEYRNDCGKYVNLALKQNPTGKLKTALDHYVHTGDLIDQMVDSTAATDVPKIAQIYAACKMGVEGLLIEV